MKKIIWMLIFVVLLAPVHAGSIKISVGEIVPQPVDVGSDLTMSVTYTNTGSDYMRNVRALLDIRYPFTLTTSTEPFDQGFDLCGLCSRTNTYYISTDANAKSGTYPIFIRTGVDASSVSTINVQVQGKPNIVLFADALINATPDTKFDLRINVANIGSGTAKQVKVISKSTSFVALGSGVATIESLEARNSSGVVFEMSPGSDLRAGAYSLPFDVEYLDESGATKTITQSIGVRVINDGKLSVQNIKVAASDGGVPTAGKPLTVIVRLENIGKGDANSIESEITCDGQSARSFLGQLKKDEDAPAVFEMNIPVGGKQECSFSAKYFDDLGEHIFTGSLDIVLKNPELPLGPVAMVIVLGGLGYFYYKKRRHRK